VKDMNLTWTEVPVDFDIISENELRVACTPSVLNNNDYIKVSDGVNVRYYYFHARTSALNANGEVIYNNMFVIDKLMSKN
jgi:hypothetical protein